MPTLIQILNNRERRNVNVRRGRMHNWRQYYPSSAEYLFIDKFSTNTTDLSLEDSKSDESIVPDFLKQGGVIFIDDTSNQDILTTRYLSLSLIPGLYKNVKKYPMQNLSIDDVADASRFYDDE
mmetsp:Transcript_18930/g.21199  ORF Transcript_18930/g.21199 Transcript_18930/m.21199 type:complete len:123 (+) Transcript_18930:443-811(+)